MNGHRCFAAAVIALSLAVAASCGSGGTPDLGRNNNQLGKLDFFITSDASSTIPSSQVTGELASADDALNARRTSALPAGMVARQGFVLDPHSPPGSGFSGRLDVRITVGPPAQDEYKDVLLFLYYIDPDTLAPLLIDSSRGRTSNRVSFDINCLGFFVVAEDSAIARPGDTFTVSAFADQSLAQVGTTVNFFALSRNGTDPVSYTWDFDDGSPAASGDSVSHVYTAAGSYSVRLTALDAQNRTAPLQSTAIVITATANPLTGVTVGEPLQDDDDARQFTMPATIQGGTAPFTLSWDMDGDGEEDASGPAPLDFTYNDYGLYGGTLTVTDANNETASDDFICDARQISITLAPEQGVAPLTSHFTIDARGFSVDDPISVDFDNGVIGLQPLGGDITFNNTGVYNVVATGTSTLGGAEHPLSSAAFTVTVTDNPNPERPILLMSQPLVLTGSETSVALHGYGFGAAQNLRSVLLDGEELAISSWTDTRILVQLPAELSPGEPLELEITDPVQGSNSMRLIADTVPRIQNVIPLTSGDGRFLVVGGNLAAGSYAITVDGTDCVLEATSQFGVLARMPGGIDLTAAPAVALTLDELTNLHFTAEALDDAGAKPSLDAIVPTERSRDADTWSLTLGGTDFGDGSRGLVFWDGLLLTTAAWSETSIGVGLPPRDGGNWLVVLDEARVSNHSQLLVDSDPVIQSLSRPDAHPGLSITVTGILFGDTQGPEDLIYIRPTEPGTSKGDAVLTVVSWSKDEIVVTIPEGADDGVVIVERNGIESNGVPIEIGPAPPGGVGGGQR